MDRKWYTNYFTKACILFSLNWNTTFITLNGHNYWLSCEVYYTPPRPPSDLFLQKPHSFPRAPSEPPSLFLFFKSFLPMFENLVLIKVINFKITLSCWTLYSKKMRRPKESWFSEWNIDDHSCLKKRRETWSRQWPRETLKKGPGPGGFRTGQEIAKSYRK